MSCTANKCSVKIDHATTTNDQTFEREAINYTSMMTQRMPQALGGGPVSVQNGDATSESSEGVGNTVMAASDGNTIHDENSAVWIRSPSPITDGTLTIDGQSESFDSG